MAGDGAKRLGPAARKLISPDAWRDGYPGPEAYSQELDVLLKFADAKGFLDRFVSTLESRDKQRDEALNELRLAYLFDCLGFAIERWDPPGLSGKKGEFLLTSKEQILVFTEIKSPGWEGELSDEHKAVRAKQPKFQGLQSGAVGNWKAVYRCISSDKTYPKFTAAQSNLLIISDDLRVPLHSSLSHVEAALYGESRTYGNDGCFNSKRFENIGGLGVFNASSSVPSKGIEYEFVIFRNPWATAATRLPPSLLNFQNKFSCIVRGTRPKGIA